MADMMIAGDCDKVPSIEEWLLRLSGVSDEELFKLWQHAEGCLALDIQSQRWAPHVATAKRIIRERKIDLR